MKKDQSGVALIVVLVMLVVITLLGVGSLRSGIFHEKMSLNSQADTMTFLAAESAINAVLTQAWNVDGDLEKANEFFGNAILFGAQQQCVTSAGPVDGRCSTEDSIDSKNNAIQAEINTQYEGTKTVDGYDVDVMAYHRFRTEGSGYFKADLKLPFATKNQQVWDRLGVKGGFALTTTDFSDALQAQNN